MNVGVDVIGEFECHPNKCGGFIAPTGYTMNIGHICIIQGSGAGDHKRKISALGVVRVVTFMNYDSTIERYAHSPNSITITYYYILCI